MHQILPTFKLLLSQAKKKKTDLSHPWCDIEDRGHIDDRLCLILPLEQDGLESKRTLAKGQPRSHQHSPGFSQNQTNQHGKNRTTRGALDESLYFAIRTAVSHRLNKPPPLPHMRHYVAGMNRGNERSGSTRT